MSKEPTYEELAQRVEELEKKAFELEDRFYNVLEDVTARNRAEEKLHRAHDLLEQRVADRTADLIKANRRLQEEVAERRRIEGALRESETLYRFSIESAPHGVMVLDREQNILIFNSQLEEISGYKKGEIPKSELKGASKQMANMSTKELKKFAVFLIKAV